MFRLDPAHPPLWRDATTLQFGLDDVARLEDPQPWEQRLLAALADGVTELGWAALLKQRRIPRAQGEALLAELQPVLIAAPPRPAIVLQVGPAVAPAVTDRVAAAMTAAGADVRMQGWPDTPPAVTAPEVVVLLAAHVVEPARAAALVSRDIPHLPVVFDGGGARVGPVIRPGLTACLACEAATARERDAQWPTVASQLVGRACAIDLEVAAEAARAAVQLLTGSEAPGRSVRLDARSPHRVWRTHRPHEECGCRSLGGTGTAPAPPVPVPATSSARGSARPA